MNDPVAAAAVAPERLLSHRLKGFDRHDSTLTGLKAALARGVKHMEFDVRMTRDGHFLAYHDPFFQDERRRFHRFRDLTLTQIRGLGSLSHVASLDQMLQCFREFAPDGVTLHIDVKAGGVEGSIMELIRRYDLVDRCVVVSWIPSVLEEVARLEPACRLCYSHVTFTRAPFLYRIAQTVLHRKALDLCAGSVGHISPYWGEQLGTLRPYFDAGGDPSPVDTDAGLIGFNHSHFIPDRVGGRMLRLLSAVNGMVCIPSFCATGGLVDRYHEDGIDVAVFPIRDRRELVRVNERVHPDIFYVDTAQLFPALEG